jgi:hypothetical protein
MDLCGIEAPMVKLTITDKFLQRQECYFILLFLNFKFRFYFWSFFVFVVIDPT